MNIIRVSNNNPGRSVEQNKDFPMSLLNSRALTKQIIVLVFFHKEAIIFEHVFKLIFPTDENFCNNKIPSRIKMICCSSFKMFSPSSFLCKHSKRMILQACEMTRMNENYIKCILT